MKLTKLLTAMVIAATATGVAQAASNDLIPGVTTSGSVAFTTDYKFRGLSQSSNNPAVQGGLRFNHTSGMYVDFWGSSIADQASEIDTSLGYATKVGGTDVDVGYKRYIYAGNASDLSWDGLYASAGWGGALMAGDVLKVGIEYDMVNANSSANGDGDSIIYINSGYTMPVSNGLGLVIGLGFNTVTKDQGTDPDDIFDYKVGATYGTNGVAAEFAYIGTDLSSSDCGSADVKCDGSFVFTLSKSF